MDQCPDETLVKRVLNRDRRAIEELWSRVGDVVTARARRVLIPLARRTGRDPASLVLEATGHVWVCLLSPQRSPLTRFDPTKGRLEAFVAIATHRRCQDFARTELRGLREVASDPAAVSLRSTASGQPECWARARQLDERLYERLVTPDQQRDWQSFFREGCGIDDYCRDHGVPRDTALRRRNRLRAAARRSLEELAGEGA